MAVREHRGTEAAGGPKPEDFAGAYHLILTQHPALVPAFCAVLADFFATGGGDEAQLRVRLTPEALATVVLEPMPLAATFESEGFARSYAIIMRESPGDPALRQALTDELVRMAQAGLAADKARERTRQANRENASGVRKAEDWTRDVLLADRADYVADHGTDYGWLPDIAARSGLSERTIQRRMVG